MSNLKHKGDTLLSRLSYGFTHGLAQIAAAGHVERRLPYKTRSAAEAFRGDWEKVGQDLGRTIERSRERIREKA
jgi:uncharacterized membrane protein